ncbi:MAG: 4-alpha-glucanotransferase [Myxococcales bacterium]
MGRFSLGRRAGLLLPLSSVRGARGDIGCYTDAGAIARFLRSAGCTLWQLLPLNEIAAGSDSPYGAVSSHALEPVYVDLAACEDVGALTPAEEESLARARDAARVDFELIRSAKRSALSRGFRRFRERELDRGSARAAAFHQFCEEKRGWLADYALYRALHDERRLSWLDWEPGLRNREPAALQAAAAAARAVIDELSYVQWIAYEQWRKGRAAANAAGVKVVGDLPFMVAGDSADVWGLQRFFRFDATVGVPPDAYSADGQDWGLPVPRWDAMREAGDPWLRPRAQTAAELHDAYRVDHVVGLYRTYARPVDRSKSYFVPEDEVRQREQGERILRLLGEGAEVLAEDLGTVPDFVRASLSAQGIPGTKVLRWEVDDGVPRDPRKFPVLSLCVTGTHDTESLASWWEGLSERERALQLSQEPLRELAGEDRTRFTPRTREAFLALAYGSASDALLTPITDVLGLRDRLNTPGTVGPHNWTYRLDFSLPELSRRPEVVAITDHLAHLAGRTGRAP